MASMASSQPLHALSDAARVVLKEIFNDRTHFVAFEALDSFEGVLSLLFVPALIASFYKLHISTRAPQASSIESLNQALAALSVAGRILVVIAAKSLPTDWQWLSLGIAVFVAIVQSQQIGRVRVSETSLLLYWFCQVFLNASFAINSGLSHKIIETVIWSALTLLAAIIVTTDSTKAAHPAPEARDSHSGKRRVPSFEDVTIFDRITMSFIEPVLHYGLKNSLERHDIPLPPTGVNAATSFAALDLALSQRTGRYRVSRSIFSIVKWKIIAEITLDGISQLLRLSQPLIFAQFLKVLGASVTDPDASVFPAYYFGALNAAVPVVTAAINAVSGLISTSVEVRASNALQGVIYRKAVRLSPRAREDFDTGKIMNMINVDAGNVHQLGYMIQSAIVTPVVFILAVLQLYELVGLVMFSAALVLIILSVVTGIGSARLMPIFPKYMAAKDERSQAITNALASIRSIKVYAWEQAFYDKIAEIRTKKELAQIIKLFKIFTPINGLWAIADDLCAVSMFIAFLYFRVGSLTADIVFPALSLFQIISGAAGTLPMLIPWVSRSITSDKRIDELLLAEEQTSQNYFRDQFTPGSQAARGVIIADHAAVSWTGEDTEDKMAIYDLSFKAVPGDFICLTGRVGSGKTAVLQAIAGQLAVVSGSISVDGSIAYCSQEPWLQNGTVKTNVCFGNRYDEAWYRQVMDACALTADVEKLVSGDETEIGQLGITLSGGQKARVALARAIYSRADIFLLDDVLSAVDEHVAKHLVDALFATDTGLLAGKTVILATNFIKVLAHASSIISLENKRDVENVSLKEMLDRKQDSVTYRLLSEFGVGGAAEVDKLEPHDRDEYVKYRSSEAAKRETAKPPSMLLSGEEVVSQRLIDSENEDKDESTSASLKVLKRYVEVVNKWALAFGVVITIASICLTNSLAVWVGVVSNHSFTNLPDAKWYVTTYVILAVLTGVSLFAGFGWFMIVMAPTAGTLLHNRMLWSVLRAPMSYFSTTPTGKILNRFTGDMDALDIGFPMELYSFFRMTLNLLVSTAITIGGTPLTLFAIGPMFYFAIGYRNLYLPTSRQVARMSQAAESPILSHIEETMKGAVIVRSFERFNQFEHVYDARVDYSNELRFLSGSVSGWLSWRITCFTELVGLIAALSATTLVERGSLTVGAVGVVVYMATRSGSLIGALINQSAGVEVSCVALERVVELIDLPQEAPEHIAETQPEGAWPKEGGVKFDQYSCRYNPGDEDVLKNISFDVKGGEKIGIVGRTGSGKSTLTMALFRIIEASGGHIDIDNVDTSKLGLRDLREHLGIIPQDSQIFKGTVRDNLDPFHSSGDTRLWEILALCHLKDHFSAMETGLETELSDGGDNLSRGQAQLICLGRALLHDSKILVLDEATASVDVETDKILQQTIRKEFAERTILTVAHRLNTILDCNRVLVLGDGEILEYGSPDELMAKKGAFYSLRNAQKSSESIDE